MKRTKVLVVACAVAMWSVAAMAVPSSNDVQAAIKAGDFPKAETMMQEVVAAKPQSAKAHYLYAEILAHDAKFLDAAAQARKARELDPQLTFTNDPEKFRSFERLLEREQAGPPATLPPMQAPTHINTAPSIQSPKQSAGVPGWVWVGGFAIVALLIFRFVSRRAMPNDTAAGGYPAPSAGYASNPGMPQPGYGPGYGPGVGATPGGGLLGTGLAVAGGVAGGMLLEKMLDGNHRDENYGNNNLSRPADASSDNASHQAASDLENRPIDFGSGGNDWDTDGAGGSDSSSAGGSDDGGGW